MRTMDLDAAEHGVALVIAIMAMTLMLTLAEPLCCCRPQRP